MGGALNSISQIGSAIGGAVGGGDIFSKIMESVQKIFGGMGQCCGGNCPSCAGGSSAAGCAGGG